jgi:hypothetical protein
MKSQPPIPIELWEQIPPAAQAAILALVQHYQQRLQDLQQGVQSVPPPPGLLVTPAAGFSGNG